MKKRSPEPDVRSQQTIRPALLLVGEGPQDIGRAENPGGALVGFLHAVLVSPGEPIENEDLPFSIGRVMRWTELQIQKPSSKQRSLTELMQLKPDGKRARAALVVASLEGYDCVAIMRDCERIANIGLGPLLREARDTYRSLVAGGEERPGLVIAGPCRCHETWLLADREAVRRVLNGKADYHFSSVPESRPHCDELKDHLNEQAERLHYSVTEVRRRLAFQARPAELGRRCPRCYPPFKEDVDSELRPRCPLAKPARDKQ